MSGPLGGDFAKQVIKRFNEVAKDHGQKLAQAWGDPIRGEKLTKEEQARLWNVRNPNADENQVAAMIAQGQYAKAVETMYPWRPTLMGQGDLKSRIDRAQQIGNAAFEQQMMGVPGDLQP